MMTKMVYCLCCSCLDLTESDITHSTDIYKELSPEDAQHEFYMTNRILKKNDAYRDENKNDEETALINYYDERIKLKLLKMRFHLLEQIKERGLGRRALKDPKEGFIAL